MATNNHALIRYRTIDRCLKSGGTYHLVDLIQECSDAINEYEASKTKSNTTSKSKLKKVSRRTLLYDLKFMKDEQHGFAAPIRSDKIDGYYYDDPQFEIFRAKISKTDLEELSDSLNILKKLSGNSQFKNLESAITRIEETYHIKRSKNQFPIVQFEHSTNIEGQKWVSELKEHIRSKAALHIEYLPFDKPIMKRIISPYLLKEYNNRWFLIAYDHDSQRISNLGLDRIQSIRSSLRAYHLEPHFKALEYLKDIVGVSKPESGQKEKILIKALGKQRHYIKTKPIHDSQETIEMNEEFGIFSIEVFVNFELQSKLLSYGKQIQVLEPVGLVERLKEQIVGMGGLY